MNTQRLQTAIAGLTACLLLAAPLHASAGPGRPRTTTAAAVGGVPAKKPGVLGGPSTAHPGAVGGVPAWAGKPGVFGPSSAAARAGAPTSAPPSAPKTGG